MAPFIRPGASAEMATRRSVVSVGGVSQDESIAVSGRPAATGRDLASGSLIPIEENTAARDAMDLFIAPRCFPRCEREAFSEGATTSSLRPCVLVRCSSASSGQMVRPGKSFFATQVITEPWSSTRISNSSPPEAMAKYSCDEKPNGSICTV